MLTIINENSHYSTQYIIFRADFGIPFLDTTPEPGTTIVSDFGNGIVW